MSTLATPALPDPTPPLMTAAEFTARYANIHAELVKGIVKEYPGSGPKHGKICIGVEIDMNKIQGPRPAPPTIEFPEITEQQRQQALAREERSRRNSRWLQAHWNDLLPQAYGKYVVVAAEEAWIAETPEAARAWARQTHPEDDTAIVQYIDAEQGARIYANRW